MDTKIEIAFFILLLLIIFKVIRKEVPIWLRYISYSMMKLSHYSKQLGVFIEEFESRDKNIDKYKTKSKKSMSKHIK